MVESFMKILLQITALSPRGEITAFYRVAARVQTSSFGPQWPMASFVGTPSTITHPQTLVNASQIVYKRTQMFKAI